MENNNDPDVSDGGKDSSRKLGGWEFYEKVLGSPKYVVGFSSFLIIIISVEQLIIFQKVHSFLKLFYLF